MSPLKLRLLEDRALRDAARAVVKADVAFLKADVQQQGVGARVAESGSDYVRTIADGAMELVEDNRGTATGLFTLAAAGLAAWFFREELTDLVMKFFGPDDAEAGTDDSAGEDAEPAGAVSHSD